MLKDESKPLTFDGFGAPNILGRIWQVYEFLICGWDSFERV
jgi:hypothetical protein